MTSAWPGNWPVDNPTPARIYVDIWLMAEFIYKTLLAHEEAITEIVAMLQGSAPAGGSLPPADMSAVDQAVTDLENLTKE